MRKQLLNRVKLVAVTGLFTILPLVSPLQAVHAAPGASTISPSAKISFTFDDGLASTYSNAAPILAKYGFVGTDFVISGCVGMTTAPNSCHANGDTSYMTWAQIQALQNSFGWEIGSHTVDHQCLASSAKQDPDDCPTKALTSAQVTAELVNSKAALASYGINAIDFASPYGDYNQAVLAQIAKVYESQRGFADTGYNTFPNNDYIVRDQQLQGGVSVATAEGYVNQAIANNTWLVFTLHDVLPNASNNPDDYQYSVATLDQLAAYVKSKGVPVVKVSDGVVNGTNMLLNSTFDDGIADGWTTDSPTTILKDTANNGNYPSPANSVSLKATTKDTHLYSPNVPVSYGSAYVLKSFLNLTKISTNTLGYYIDEYNANGNWVSGQYKQGINFPWPQTAGFEYKPSSASVTSARLQIIIPANSGIQAYVDNVQWVNENVAVSTPPPVQTNLVANGTFDDGIADGWTTDSAANFSKDSANNGSPVNPVNAIKITSTSKNVHLFSPKIAVSSPNSYSLSAYLNIKQITGASSEVGFYIDEYDASGKWISGQYKTGSRLIGANTVAFSYTPSSASVKQASLQIISMANSNLLAYLDNIVWIQN